MVATETESNLQFSAVPIICNAVLINRSGRWVGWGDLKTSDFYEHQSKLSEDDIVIVAWGRQTGDNIKSYMQIDSHPDNIKIAISTACFVITKDSLLGVDRSGYCPKFKTVRYAGLELKMIKSETLEVMLLDYKLHR